MTILVLGGTGKTGRRVAEHLQAQGRDVRVASRKGTTRFDWADPATWDGALEGAEAIYLVTDPGKLDPSAEVEDLLSRTRARVVLLSSRDIFSPAERVVRGKAREWTILRPSWFNQNFSEDLFADEVRQGGLALPTGEGKEAFIDADDIAQVAVAALTDPSHVGQTYELSGPEALSFREALTRIGAAQGETVTYEPIDAAAYREKLLGYGLDDEYADVFVNLLTDIANSKGSRVSDGVEKVLGRPARSFADFVAATWPR